MVAFVPTAGTSMICAKSASRGQINAGSEVSRHLAAAGPSMGSEKSSCFCSVALFHLRQNLGCPTPAGAAVVVVCRARSIRNPAAASFGSPCRRAKRCRSDAGCCRTQFCEQPRDGLNRGQEQTDEHADDGDHHQQLDERKGAAERNARSHGDTRYRATWRTKRTRVAAGKRAAQLS